MVQAILDGRKTMTRRVIEWPPYRDGEAVNFGFTGMSLGHYCTGVPESGYVLYSRGKGGCWNQKTKPIHPPCQPGDILWVRETWCIFDDLPYDNYAYRSDYGTTEDDSFPPSMFKWRPSIHMPKVAARIFLRVTGVRAERVQEITLSDIEREGLYCDPPYTRDHFAYAPGMWKHWRMLWDSINAKRGYGWDTNPWVWVYTFERMDKPKDWPVDYDTD